LFCATRNIKHEAVVISGAETDVPPISIAPLISTGRMVGTTLEVIEPVEGMVVFSTSC
jgi:hypothetical protein